MDVVALLVGIVGGALGAWFAFRPSLRDLRSLRTEAESLRADRATDNARAVSLQQQLDAATRDLQTGRAQVLELTSDRSRLTTSLEATREKLEAHTRELQELNTRFTETFTAVAHRLMLESADRIQEQHRGTLDDLLTPLKEKLDRFERKVEETHRENIRDNQSLKEQIATLQKLNQSIGDEARNLTTALKGQTKTQGNWGEVILERILEKSGLVRGREYEVQLSHTSDDGRRLQPDIVIHLPEDKTLVVDAKVSLTAYERYCSATGDGERETALREHVASLRRHVKELSLKSYHDLYGIASPDFVLMFLPVEPAFHLVMQHDATVYDDAVGRNIVIVSQSTLMATLLTIASIWRREYQNQNAFEIARKAGDLYDKFVGFVEDMLDLGKRLQMADRSYDSAMKKLQTGRGNLLTKAEELRGLGARTTKALPAAPGEEEDGSPGPGPENASAAR